MSTINIDDLTIGQAKELANRFAPTSEHAHATDVSAHLIDRWVIVRTYSAGVHFGTLKARSGTEVLLVNARRIWYWNKAFTLNKVAVDGIGGDSKLSVAVPEIALTEAIELILVGDEIAKKINAFPAHKPE